MNKNKPVESFVDLDMATCAKIQEFHDRLEEMNLFELLGAEADADLATLRRAYFSRSKEFHPDRFFSHRLGPYKQLLERIFQWCSAAFKFLKDERQRQLYMERVLRLQGARKRRPPSARIVPVERDSGLEFVIADESAPVPASESTKSRRRALAADEAGNAALEFFIEEERPAKQQTDGEEGLEFVIDD